MTVGEPRHRHWGTPLSDWIRRVPHELEVDAIGLWQIVPVLKHDFALTGVSLQSATARCIERILERGARVVQGSAHPGQFWEYVLEFRDGNATEAADRIAREWADRDDEPGFGDLWFAIPNVHFPDPPIEDPGSDAGAAVPPSS